MMRAHSDGKGPIITLLLCRDLQDLGHGLNVSEVVDWLERFYPMVRIQVVDNLCHRPQKLSVAGANTERLVLGVCSPDLPERHIHARARRMGLDPFGLEMVDLGSYCARVHPRVQGTEKAKMLLAAAVARARAFEGSGPEHARPYFLSLDRKVSRRSLFTVPPIRYRPTPSIRKERCATEAGCQLCAMACPSGALWKTNGYFSVDKTICQGCGVCLAACPREAIKFPGWSLSQFEAQLASLLDTATLAGEPFGLLLACQKAVGRLEELARQGVPYSHHWLAVTVPCLGMVTPTWILQALVHGADAVSLLSCGADCPFGQQQAIGGRANFCRRVLRLLGHYPQRVHVLSTSRPMGLLRALQEAPPRKDSRHRSRPGEPLRLGTTEDAFQAIRYLADGDGASHRIVLEHPYSPFGVLEFWAEGCTGCLACVKACPTGALRSEPLGNGVTLAYSPSSCTGCGMCVDVCPESAAKVLGVRRMTNLGILFLGREVLYKHQLVSCEGCGASIAPQALLRRIEVLLEGSTEALRSALVRYCPSCRASFAWSASP